MTNKITSPQQNHPYPEEDQINLIVYAKTIWNSRKTVIKITLLFMVIGLFIAVFSPTEYTATTTIVPQSSKDSKLGGNLSGLAAIAGINLGSNENDSGISPLLYPEIKNSLPFLLELLQTPLTIEGLEEQVTYADYYTNIYRPGLLDNIKKYTIGLPGIIIKAIKPQPSTLSFEPSIVTNQLLSITNEEFGLIKQLKDQVALDVNAKEGYVTIIANMPEAIVSAELARKVQQLLQDYVIKFKIQRSTEKLKFIEERYIEKKKSFERIQKNLANYRDQNQNIVTAIAQTQLQGLQSEYDLAYDVYSELAKQLEAQRIQNKEDTPVFTILKPVSIPNERSKPLRKKILMTWAFLGIILGIGMVFGQKLVESLKIKWDDIK